MIRAVEDQGAAGKEWVHRPLPGVFAPMTLTLKEGETPRPIEVRASPYVVVEGGWVDSKGKPRAGSSFMIIGHVDGQSWHTMVEPTDDGRFSQRIPHAMDDVQITIFPGESITSTRYRLGKGAKLEAGQVIMLRTLDHDLKDVELIQYDETAVVVKVEAKDGHPLKDVEVGGEYTGEIAMAGFKMGLKNGAMTEVFFNPQDDGRIRGKRIVPGRELKVTAYAEGFKPASRTVNVAEGKTEEITIVLEPK